jgi:uncharacterized protein
MICASPQVSTLDGQLGTLYSSAKAAEPVRASQRAWLTNVRNKCTTSECLVQAYTARIAELKNSSEAGASAPCPVTNSTLLGDWRNPSESGFYEELDFSMADGKQHFVSWAHNAPFAMGVWELQQCHIHVQGNNDSIQFDFTVQGFDHGKLKLHDEDEGTTLVLEKKSPRK